jgi:two-component system sensor histidine kinase/response regulator
MTDPHLEATYVLPPTLLHDLRTPLNQIIGFSEMLLEQTTEEGYDKFAPDLSKILRAGQTLLSTLAHSFASEASEQSFQVASLAPLREAVGVVDAGARPALASGTEKGFILVVDDDEGNRDVLSRRLELQGYSVDTAENGERALEMLGDDTFDLVLLDILMPGTDGYEVLRQIKGDDRLINIPVIMISALEDVELVARCIEMGAEDYLSKPFNPTLLSARIGACLGRKRSRDREALLFAQLNENYKRLQDLETLRDDLTHIIVHDLRTPLTSLIAGIQTMDTTGELNTDQKEMMGVAISGGETLLAMINDLLDVEKLESGLMHVDHEDLSALELAQSAASQVSALAIAKGLKIEMQVESSLPSFRGDKDKLLRTLVNLLGNAIKFTPSGGMVTVTAFPSEDGSSLSFSVTDTGDGIPHESFKRIFEKFGQVEPQSGVRVAGTGLGLTFCKLAVEAHGGEIHVDSQPGEGSTFSFSIPLVPRSNPVSAFPQLL